MKKLISLVVALIIAAMQTVGIAYAEADDAYAGYFPEQEEIVVAAIGGSITAVGGTTASWGKYFSDWLSEKTGKTVTFYNKGVGGTGSDFGIARLYEDISSLAPDIVFVEFSVNDRMIASESSEATTEENTVITFNNETKKYELPVDENGNEYLVYNGYKYTYTKNQGKIDIVKRDMEAITRQLLALPKKPVIIYNYVGLGVTHIANTSTDANRIGRLVMPRACKEIHEEVAEKYGIPSIDIDSYIQNIMVNGAEALDANTYTQNEIFSETDCVHPNTTVGTRLYADFMINTVEADLDKYLNTAAADVSEIEKYSNNVYDDTFYTIPYTESVITGTGWKETSYSSKKQVITEVEGDTVSFDFDGNVVILRGAHVGGSFTVEITNEDGTTVTETKSVGANTSSAYDSLYTNTNLPDGKHTIKITKNTGKLAVHGISVNGEVPEEGFKSEEAFRNEYAAILEKTIGSFSCTFDDLKDDVVDAGWTKDDSISWEVKDGMLALTGGVDASDGKCEGISIPVSENESDIIYLGLDFINTGSTGIRIINGSNLGTGELFGMIYGNDAGVFIRDGNNKATRFKAENAFWPEAEVTHRLELILNYKNNDFRLYIDGVEAAYTNGEVSTQGATTIKGSSLELVKIGLSAVTTAPVYLDNFDLMGYDDYLEREIFNFNIYTGDASERIATIKTRAEYLETNEKPISAEAEAKIPEIEAEIEALATRESILTGSLNNSYLAGANELFTFSCDGISKIKIDGVEITENEEYQIKDNKILFDGSVFADEKTYAVETTDNDGNVYLDNIEITAPETMYYPLWGSGAVSGVVTEGSNYGASDWVATGSYSGESSKIFQVYKGAAATNASITLTGREEFKGEYKVEWFDLAALHSTNGIYAMPKLNAEISNAAGVSSFTFNTTRDNTWHDLGTYTFNGTTDEYIKVSNGVTVGMDPGTRFFAEIIRFTESSNDTILWKEFLNLPENVTISENEINVNKTDVARIISIDGDFSMEYVETVYVNGTKTDYDVKGRNILISESGFENAGEYTVKVKLIDGTETNELSFTLEEPVSITYTWQDENATKVTETTDVSTAGVNHSRSGSVAPLKIGTQNEEIVPNEGKTLDEAVYVKWDLTGIAEGDYLVDTWLPAGWLARALKAEVVSDGGATKKVYRSIQLGGVPEGTACYSEGYFGNGAKIHFTGEGNEYIKLMLDDDYLSCAGRFLLIDSVRLTPWYDMNSVYDTFYGDGVITLDNAKTTTQSGTDTEGNSVSIQVAEVTLNTKYKMNKIGYNVYVAAYDADGRLAGVAKKDNIAIYDGDKNITVRVNLTNAGIDMTDKTYKVFLWGSDADPDNDTSMKPFVK